MPQSVVTACRHCGQHFRRGLRRQRQNYIINDIDGDAAALANLGFDVCD